jgi:hypothetical protein
MSLAFRVWSWALAFCFAFCIVGSCFGDGAGGFMLIIFFIVAVASVISLMGFCLLFEILKQVSSSPWVFWIGALLFVPVIVFLNAWLLICGFDGGFSINAHGSGLMVLGFAAIPLGATFLGMLVSYKHINAFLKPKEEAELISQC